MLGSLLNSIAISVKFFSTASSCLYACKAFFHSITARWKRFFLLHYLSSSPMNWLSQAAGLSPQSRPRTFNQLAPTTDSSQKMFINHCWSILLFAPSIDVFFFCTLSINHSFLTRESSICNLNLGQIENSAPWCQGTGFSVRQSSDPQSAQMNMVPYPVLQDQSEIFFFSSKLKQNRQVLLPSNLHVQPSREREMRTSRRSPSLAVPYSRP